MSDPWEEFLEDHRAWQEDQRRATQRGARMQIMREWMQQYSYEKSNFFDNSCWHDFMKAHPEAADWFDEDGVPE